MDLQSPPSYSLLEKLNLEGPPTDGWKSLSEYVPRFPAPSLEYNMYTVAIIGSKEANLKGRISAVLAESGIAHAIMRNDDNTVVFMRTKETKSALVGLANVSVKCAISANQLEIVDDSTRLENGRSGVWPLVIPYAATILPTPAKWYDRERPTSSGCLNDGSPNVKPLMLAAASPKLRRAASVVTGAVSALLNAATFEKVGGTIGVFMGGAPGAAAGTLAGRSVDGLQTTSGNRNGDENVPQEGQITEAWIMRLVESGRMTAAEGRDLLCGTAANRRADPASRRAERRAEIVLASLARGMSVEEIKTIVALSKLE